MAKHFLRSSSYTAMESTPKSGHSAEVSEDGMNPTGELSFVTLDDTNDLEDNREHTLYSEDSGIGVSNTSLQISPPNSTDAAILSPTNSQVDEIGKKTHNLIERINERLAMDEHMISSFEEQLIKKVNEMCQKVKEQMFEYSEEHSQGIESSINELSEVLERCNQLSMELQGASQTLAAINKGLQHNTE